MPHIILEYSKDIEKAESVDIDSVCAASRKILLDTNEFPDEAVKARVSVYNRVFLAPSVKNFIHVTVRLLAGREKALLGRISDSIFLLLKSVVSCETAVSVDVVEMDAKLYRK